MYTNFCIERSLSSFKINFLEIIDSTQFFCRYSKHFDILFRIQYTFFGLSSAVTNFYPLTWILFLERAKSYLEPNLKKVDKQAELKTCEYVQ